MKVFIEASFLSNPTDDDEAALRQIANRHTNNSDSVRVYKLDGQPLWLGVEFSMPEQAQYKAVDLMYPTIKLWLLNRDELTIRFESRKRKRAPRRKQPNS